MVNAARYRTVALPPQAVRRHSDDVQVQGSLADEKQARLGVGCSVKKEGDGSRHCETAAPVHLHVV